MIYVMGEARTGTVKIGVATNPSARLRQIQAGYPRPLQVLLSLPGDRSVEQRLHSRFASRRVSAREWFDFGDTDAVDAVFAAWGDLDRPSATAAPDHALARFKEHPVSPRPPYGSGSPEVIKRAVQLLPANCQCRGSQACERCCMHPAHA